MSYQKQPQLNGAYYGPAIPPPQHSHRPGRGGRGCCARCGCCLFDCLCDCGCCLLGCVFKIICSILIVIGLIVLAVWLIVLPHEPKFYASDASLAGFNYSGNQLSYDFKVNVTIRNPNRRMGIYFDQFEANAFFEDQRFDTTLVDPFFQETKNTTDVGPVAFKGQKVIALGSDQSSDYELQKSTGKFNIVVRLHLKVRFKIGLFKTGKWKPKVKCDLSVPLSSSSSSSAKFETTKCDYYF